MYEAPVKDLNFVIKNLINLQGIESPGLTSSLAIGKLVKNLL